MHTMRVSDTTPPPRRSVRHPSINSPGGVALSAANGRIVCDNTLSSRLTVIYAELLPKIRGLLFPTA